MNRDGGLVPIAEWAELSHLPVEAARRRLRRGHPAGKKINGRWFVYLTAWSRKALETHKRLVERRAEFDRNSQEKG